MKSPGIQPFCRKRNINIGCFTGKEIHPRNITQRNKALFIHNLQFCLIWKSQIISFNQGTKEELKSNFSVFEKLMSDKHVENFIKYEYNPNKAQPPLTNIIFFVIETFNKVRVVRYCSRI